jgi:hypothetical protein
MKGTSKKTATAVPFSRLTPAQQKEVLKKGAANFSKDFTKVFEKLAKE